MSNVYFSLDTAAWLEQNSSATYGDLYEDYIVPRFQAKFSSACEYVELSGYPGVKLPWFDGTVGEDVFPYIISGKTATTAVASNYDTIKFGCGSKTDSNGKNAYKNSTQGGGGQSTWDYTGTVGVVRVFTDDDGYHIGLFPTNAADACINAPYHITTMKDNNDNTVNAMIWSFMATYSSSSTPSIQIVVSDNNAERSYRLAVTGPYDLTDNVGVVMPIDCGKYHHENWCVYSQYYRTLKGEWDNDLNLLISDTYGSNLWYPDAFTINDKSYDVFILGSSFSDNRYGASLCK